MLRYDQHKCNEQNMSLFFRDIGVEAIKRGGFAKFVDVRHLEGYPDVGRLESKG